jgi:hypothetical protein
MYPEPNPTKKQVTGTFKHLKETMETEGGSEELLHELKPTFNENFEEVTSLEKEGILTEISEQKAAKKHRKVNRREKGKP